MMILELDVIEPCALDKRKISTSRLSCWTNNNECLIAVHTHQPHTGEMVAEDDKEEVE